jgi:Flp pilus assembly protein TadG
MTRAAGLSIRGLPVPRRADRERGSMSVEIAVVAPALVFLLLIVAFAGRLVESQNAIDGAARDAARAASLARYPGTGQLGATTLAQQAAAGDLTGFCTGANLDVTVSGFPGLDQPAQLGDNVTVTVTCDINTVPWASSLFGVGDRHQMTGTAVAPLDPFMCRGTEC